MKEGLFEQFRRGASSEESEHIGAAEWRGKVKVLCTPGATLHNIGK